jgi:hypothetical protein
MDNSFILDTLREAILSQKLRDGPSTPFIECDSPMKPAMLKIVS